MIRKILKIFTYIFIVILKCIYPYKLSLQLNEYKNILLTIWLKSDFKEFGKKSILRKGINLKGGKYIYIGNNVSIGKNVVLNAWENYKNNKYCPDLKIGDNCSIGDHCHLTCINGIEIKNNVLFGRYILISDNSHGETTIESLNQSPIERDLTSKGKIYVGNNVWIGDKVTILAGVTIGDNTIIGANSVVTKDIPQNCVVGGIPARTIKTIEK